MVGLRTRLAGGGGRFTLRLRARFLPIVTLLRIRSRRGGARFLWVVSSPKKKTSPKPFQLTPPSRSYSPHTGAVNLYFAFTELDAVTHDKTIIPDFKSFVPGPQFHRCNFIRNKAQGEQSHSDHNSDQNTVSLMQSGRGGAIASTASKAYITESTFYANQATAKRGSVIPSMGGAMFLDYDSQSYIWSSSFKHNEATYGAGSEIASFATARYSDSEATATATVFGGDDENHDDDDPSDDPSDDDPSEEVNDITQLKIKKCSFTPVENLQSEHSDEWDYLQRNSNSNSNSKVDSVWSSKSTILAFGGIIQLKQCTYDKHTSIIIAGPGSMKLLGPYVDQMALGEARLYVTGGIQEAVMDVTSWNSQVSERSERALMKKRNIYEPLLN